MIVVLYEDPYLAVVDKPAGLMAHASAMARGEDDFLDERLRLFDVVVLHWHGVVPTKLDV